ncbi:hypothetical protein PZH32_12655, partial [Adlercreutzia equolifaciens]|uniref:hypothetical protein n=1 Tax=Adlercreutzia equolifaciens TaxID=446660 RepID=UPI0023B0334C
SFVSFFMKFLPYRTGSPSLPSLYNFTVLKHYSAAEYTTERDVVKRERIIGRLDAPTTSRRLGQSPSAELFDFEPRLIEIPKPKKGNKLFNRKR